MTGVIEPRIGAQLYALLPEVYRERDATGDLAKYLASCGDLLDRVYATLRQRLDDHFPDSCQEWLIPYFADLLDVALKSPEASGRRTEVARAIAWRQRKGTAACTEEIAEAVGAMEVELQEGWRRVARTAHIGEKLLPSAFLDGTSEPDPNDPLSAGRHPDLPLVTVDFRRPSRAIRASQPNLVTRRTRFPNIADPVLWRQANPHGVPCFAGSYEDRSMRTVDFRTPNWNRGHFHPKRLLAFVAPAAGFFPASAPSFAWSELEQAIADNLIERTLLEPAMHAGKLIRRTIYRRPSSQAVTIRITGLITLNEPVVDGEVRVYRFEGFNASAIIVEDGRLELERCAVFEVFVQGQDTAGAVAFGAVDCLFSEVDVEGLAQLEYCTVGERIACEALRAVDCLFVGSLSRLGDPSRPPHIQCLRNVRVPRALLDAFQEQAEDSPELREEKLEERKLIQRYTTDEPAFFPGLWDVPGAGVLHPATPVSIGAGAEDGSELGAYHHQHLTLRTAAVLEKLAEFLPFGMEAVLIPDQRLTCAPPHSQQP